MFFYSIVFSCSERIARSSSGARKNGGIKNIYKYRASRWSPTHCNMMHGTYNVELRTMTTHTTQRSILRVPKDDAPIETREILSQTNDYCSSVFCGSVADT
jgi:hypothetical protein